MREIPLSQGKVALVDDDDFESLSRVKWHAHKGKKGNFYAARNVIRDGKRGLELLHCVILGYSGIDHIDGKGLNNQRSNLRVASVQQNNMNKGKKRRKLGLEPTSKFIGVSFHRAAGKWAAQIRRGEQRLYLGLFAEESAAARAYDKAAIKLFGQFARLNLTD